MSVCLNYHYAPYDQRCDWQKERVSVVGISGHEDVPVSGPAMIAALRRGPVSIAIDASSQDFQNYDRGIYHGTCSQSVKSLDHGVLAVGFRLDDDRKHGVITVKNSWGESWGNRGYIDFNYNAEDDAGACGMNLQAVLPTGAAMHAPTPTPPPPPMCSKGTIFHPAFYCPYNSTCCPYKTIFGRTAYTCCPDGTACQARAAEPAVMGHATCTNATTELPH